MANKQLKIWHDDFWRYYHKTPLMMRIVIGAVLSFAVAYGTIHKVIKPQNQRLKALRQKVNSLEVIDDPDLTISDLHNSQRKVQRRLSGLEAANRQLALICGNLTAGDTGKSILDLRLLLDRNELRIISEERLKPDRRSYRNNRYHKLKDTRVKLVLPSSMGCDSYRFELLGSFHHLQHFLLEVFNSDSMFFINNIELVGTNEIITDQNFNQQMALRCNFEVHVPYQKSRSAK